MIFRDKIKMEECLSPFFSLMEKTIEYMYNYMYIYKYEYLVCGEIIGKVIF